MSWKRLTRKTIYETKFLTVFEDKVELPNGNIYKDYSVVKFPDVVVIVATDFEGKVITLNEYKYGAEKIMRALPAGHIEENEEVIATARRELMEETGFGEGKFELIGKIHEFSTKIVSTVYVVRATGVEKISQQHLDLNEEITVCLNSSEELRREIDEKMWEQSSSLAAFTLTGILNP